MGTARTNISELKSRRFDFHLFPNIPVFITVAISENTHTACKVLEGIAFQSKSVLRYITVQLSISIEKIGYKAIFCSVLRKILQALNLITLMRLAHYFIKSRIFYVYFIKKSVYFVKLKQFLYLRKIEKC